MNESKATRYQRWRRRAHLAGSGAAVLMLALIALTPASTWLAALAAAFIGGWSHPLQPAVTLLLFVLLVVLLWEAASLPATIYVALRLDRDYAKRAISLEDVLGAQALATAVAVPAAIGAAGIVQISAVVAGPGWWILAGVLLSLTLAGAVRLAPMWLTWLGEVQPVGRVALASRLRDLAQAAGVPLAGLSEWRIAEPAPTPALVTGVGRGRRVLLAAEVVRDWSDEEIAVVVAHELAHHAHRDLWRTWALNAGILLVGLGTADQTLRLTGAAESGAAAPAVLAALPLIALVTVSVWIIATPVRHALSRSQERHADAFALALTGSADAFGTALRRLGARHLAEDRPSVVTRWLYFSHPPMAERLAFAEAYRRRQTGAIESRSRA